MARTQIEIYCPWGRDVSWITQEICETYAGACLVPGKKAAEDTLISLAGGDYARAETLRQLLVNNPDFHQLKNDLLDEFGKSHFIKIKDHDVAVAELEQRMEAETNNDTFAKLHKEWRELRGFVHKPKETPPVVNNISVQTTQGISIDRHNPKEVARIYHSVIG